MSDHPGYVYVLTNPAWPGWVKVGCILGTSRHVDGIMSSRISNYNVADPHKGFTVVRSERSTGCARIAEGYAHRLLALHFKRGQGEWFKCSKDRALEVVEAACAVARLHPSRRKNYFERVLAEERVKVPQDDTQKFMQEMAEIDTKKKRPDVTETVHAAHHMIEILLSEWQMARDYITTEGDKKVEAAAKAVLRRLDALRKPA